MWLLSESYNAAGFGESEFLKVEGDKDFLVEVGPRLNFSTAWSTNAISIFHACGLDNIPRAECSRRYLLHCSEPLTEEEKRAFTGSYFHVSLMCSFDSRSYDRTTLRIPSHLLQDWFGGRSHQNLSRRCQRS